MITQLLGRYDGNHIHFKNAGLDIQLSQQNYLFQRNDWFLSVSRPVVALLWRTEDRGISHYKDKINASCSQNSREAYERNIVL